MLPNLLPQIAKRREVHERFAKDVSACMTGNLPHGFIERLGIMVTPTQESLLALELLLQRWHCDLHGRAEHGEHILEHVIGVILFVAVVAN